MIRFFSGYFCNSSTFEWLNNKRVEKNLDLIIFSPGCEHPLFLIFSIFLNIMSLGLQSTPMESHTFGLHWTSKSLEWFFDGKSVRKVTDSRAIPHTEEYMILSGGIINKNNAVERAQFPDSMVIDYVRAWTPK